MVGDFGGAEFRDHQIGDRPDTFRFRNDQGSVGASEHVDVPAVLIDPVGETVFDGHVSAAFDELPCDARIQIAARLISRASHGRPFHGRLIQAGIRRDTFRAQPAGRGPESWQCGRTLFSIARAARNYPDARNNFV